MLKTHWRIPVLVFVFLLIPLSFSTAEGPVNFSSLCGQSGNCMPANCIFTCVDDLGPLPCARECAGANC